MSPVPDKVRLFHITAIANLPAILERGALFAKNVLAANELGYASIAHEHIQGRRAAKPVALPPYGTQHDYVPFYFAPRSPMLNVIHHGGVAGCTTRQEEIVHLVTRPQNVVDIERPFVFYDQHAALKYSIPYNDLADLDKIDWTLITEPPHIDGPGKYSKYFLNKPEHERWFRRMEVRQAEFLVYEHLPLTALTGIATQNEAKREEISALLAQAGLTELKVAAFPGWYF